MSGREPSTRFAVVTSSSTDLPGTNAPYGIVTHCLGVLDYWVGQCVAGRTIQRDREAEFRAQGPVAPHCCTPTRTWPSTSGSWSSPVTCSSTPAGR